MACYLKIQKIEDRKIASNFNEIWFLGVILGVESEFRVILLLFKGKIVKNVIFKNVIFRTKSQKNDPFFNGH